jgi:hypothetical protein
MAERTATIISKTSGLSIELSPDEYRLALLGQVDFGGQWPALAAATGWVADGAAKAALIRARLLPIADLLGSIGSQVDAMEMVIVRHWFRNLPCSTPVAGQEAAA